MNKRIFDFVFAVLLLALLLPVFAIIILVILYYDRGPIFYSSERMKDLDKSFKLWKFRTMSPDLNDTGASGGHKYSRITKAGLVLRKFRLDELPQLINIIFGDLSFVGARPPLRKYVEQFPNVYLKVLTSKPGVTGLASLYFHKHEEYLLKNTKSNKENEYVYCQRCIPTKAKLDQIYNNNSSICYDIFIIFLTVKKIFFKD